MTRLLSIWTRKIIAVILLFLLLTNSLQGDPSFLRMFSLSLLIIIPEKSKKQPRMNSNKEQRQYVHMLMPFIHVITCNIFCMNKTHFFPYKEKSCECVSASSKTRGRHKGDSSSSMEARRCVWTNVPKPSTKTTHFIVIESLQIQSHEADHENTHPQLHLGQHSTPGDAASLVAFAGLVIQFCNIQLCKDSCLPLFLTLCHYDHKNEHQGIYSVMQCCCVSSFPICSAHWTSLPLPQKEKETFIFFFASRWMKSERSLGPVLCLSFVNTWNPSQVHYWSHQTCRHPAISQECPHSPPAFAGLSWGKSSHLPREGEITKINTPPTPLSSVFPRTVGIRERIFLLADLKSCWFSFFLFQSTRIDTYCQLRDVSVKQNSFCWGP